MKFSELWLREWVNPAIDSAALSEQITMAGLEVGGVEPVAGAFHGVVVGEVVECGQHPNADKLRVTKINIGGDRLLDIVCGAPNCRQGLKVAVATVGAVLPGDFKIKAAKLRGEPSEGMLCSFSELGIDDDHNGIIELPLEAPVGTDIREFLQLDDSTIEISVTPNRADCLGIIGVARDVSVLNKMPLIGPDIVPVRPTIQDTLPICVEAPDACPRYLGRIIKGINIKAATPLWMKEKLRRCGIRSIDPVVDITNFVLLELGQPMHAFDLDRIAGGITVRMAKEGEALTLLNGTEAKLSADTLVIADNHQALAMGVSSAVRILALVKKPLACCLSVHSSGRCQLPDAHDATGCIPMRLIATNAVLILRCSIRRWSVRLACCWISVVVKRGRLLMSATQQRCLPVQLLRYTVKSWIALLDMPSLTAMSVIFFSDWDARLVKATASGRQPHHHGVSIWLSKKTWWKRWHAFTAITIFRM